MVVRRGLVMQTTDELTNIRMIFQGGAQFGNDGSAGQPGIGGTARRVCGHCSEW